MTDGKTRADSLTVMTELVLPNDTNLIGNLLGGTLLHWIDISGALAASRHTGGLVATITMDMVEFKYPVKVGRIVVLTSYVTWTGKTSVEVAVEVASEDSLTGEKRFINKVYLVFVGIDENGCKRDIVPFIPQSPQEQREFDDGFIRKNRRLELLKNPYMHSVVI